MMIEVLKSKIHRATVTEADLNYVGSITIDEALAEAAGLLENEKVEVLNLNNGARFQTYVIMGKSGSGQVCLNGPAARQALPGDLVIVVSYATMSVEEARKFKPTIVFPNEKNKI